MMGRSRLVLAIGLLLGVGGALMVGTSWASLRALAPAEPMTVDCARVPALSVGEWVRLRGCRPLPERAMDVVRDADAVDALRAAVGSPDVEQVILPLAPDDPSETRPTMYLALAPRVDVDALTRSEAFEGTVMERPRLRRDSELQLEELRMVGYGVSPAQARAFDVMSARLGALGMLLSCPVFALAWVLARRARQSAITTRAP